MRWFYSFFNYEYGAVPVSLVIFSPKFFLLLFFNKIKIKHTFELC